MRQQFFLWRVLGCPHLQNYGSGKYNIQANFRWLPDNPSSIPTLHWKPSNLNCKTACQKSIARQCHAGLYKDFASFPQFLPSFSFSDIHARHTTNISNTLLAESSCCPHAYSQDKLPLPLSSSSRLSNSHYNQLPLLPHKVFPPEI